ncbi:MAG: hypothetical protein GY939_25520 [Actinomycetia bacterium]|nr:hypothetical protein [Actinomycetes bacterium]
MSATEGDRGLYRSSVSPCSAFVPFSLAQLDRFRRAIQRVDRDDLARVEEVDRFTLDERAGVRRDVGVSVTDVVAQAVLNTRQRRPSFSWTSTGLPSCRRRVEMTSVSAGPRTCSITTRSFTTLTSCTTMEEWEAATSATGLGEVIEVGFVEPECGFNPGVDGTPLCEAVSTAPD